MRNKRTTKSIDELMDEYDKKINNRVCKMCNVGYYRLHHDDPNRYETCTICGHSREIAKRTEKKSPT